MYSSDLRSRLRFSIYQLTYAMYGRPIGYKLNGMGLLNSTKSMYHHYWNDEVLV